MTSRAGIRMAYLAVIAGGWAASTVQGADQAPVNVVVIVADDLGYGDLGCFGGRQIPTPHIDQLAKQGVRCTSGYVSGPYCSPTRAGFLTGRYQQRFGHEFNPGGGQRGAQQEIGLSLEEKTLADRFKTAGYATGLVGKWHLGNAAKFHPQQRGFDEFFGFLGGAHPYFPNTEQAAPILRGTEEVNEREYLTDAFTREAVSFIERKQDKPFFLYLAYNAVHNPQHAKPEHLERFASIEDSRRRTYAGMLTALDDGVGRVLTKLKESQLEGRTLVVFFSDNGGPPVNGSTNTPLNGQKATTWEGGIRVPFVLRWPGKLPAGSEYHQPVIQLDLVPTTLAAAGIPVNDQDKLDGVNLLPYVSGEKTGAPHDALYWRFGEQIALRQGDWKLVKVRGDKEPRLYNLKEEIGEKTDLAAAEQERVGKLVATWESWNKTLQEPKWVPAPQRAAGRKNARAK